MLETGQQSNERRRKTLFILVFVEVASLFAIAAPNHIGVSGPRQLMDDYNSLVCRVVAVEVQLPRGKGTHSEPLFRCETTPEQEPDGQGEMTYALDLPPSFMAQNPYLHMGETYIEIPYGIASRADLGKDSSITYPSDSSISTMVVYNRQLGGPIVPSSVTGNRTVLVLRVTALDSQVTVSQQKISATTFGLGVSPEKLNLRSQFYACSFGKLDMKPAEGPDIFDGVGEIFVEQNVSGTSTLALDNVLVTLTEAKFGKIKDNYHHVVFCMPPGLLLQGNSFIAYALVNHWRSVFNNEWCTKFSAMAHEIGMWPLQQSVLLVFLISHILSQYPVKDIISIFDTLVKTEMPIKTPPD